jgi:hypothetical protein
MFNLTQSFMKKFGQKLTVVAAYSLLIVSLTALGAWTGDAPNPKPASTTYEGSDNCPQSCKTKVVITGECSCKTCPGNAQEWPDCKCVNNPDGKVYKETYTGTCVRHIPPWPGWIYYTCEYASEPSSAKDVKGPNCGVSIDG